MKRLLRTLSLADLTVLASSSMAPAYSIATVMGLVVAAAGLGAPLALVVSTIPIAFIAAGFLRLSARLPSAGGVYTWSRAAFGNRVGWFSAVLIIIAYYFGTIATAVPAGTYSVVFVAPQFAQAPPPMLVAIVGILWIAFSTYFLIIGARPTAMLSAFFVGFELLALLVIAALAFLRPFAGTAPPHPMPFGFGIGRSGADGLIVGAVLSIWITAGWEISTYSSEESTKGLATPGTGAIIGLLGTTLIVVVCMIGFLRVGTVDGFAQHQSDALSYVAQRLGGGWITWLMTATVLVSTAASLWTTMFTVARAVFAMGRDGLLPRALGSVHPKYGSPWIAILVVSVPIAAVMLIAGAMESVQKTLLDVVAASSIFLGETFIICGLACAWLYLRERRPEVRRPLTGIALPLLGALGTLALLIYSVLTQQPQIVQIFSAVGVIVAVAFAATAGRWSPAQPVTLLPQEEALP